MSDKEGQVHVKIDKELKQRAKAKLPHGGLSEQVRQTIRRVADGNAERYQLREELTDLRDEREELKQERAAIDRKLTDIERKIERKEEKLEQYSDPESEYKGYLKGILQDMHEQGMRVDTEHGKVIEASEMGGKSPEAVIQDLKDMSEGLPEERFSFDTFVPR